jgi:hypothetical protein
VFHPDRDQVAHYYRIQELKSVGDIVAEIPHNQGPPAI